MQQDRGLVRIQAKALDVASDSGLHVRADWIDGLMLGISRAQCGLRESLVLETGIMRLQLYQDLPTRDRYVVSTRRTMWTLHAHRLGLEARV